MQPTSNQTTQVLKVNPKQYRLNNRSRDNPKGGFVMNNNSTAWNEIVLANNFTIKKF